LNNKDIIIIIIISGKTAPDAVTFFWKQLGNLSGPVPVCLTPGKRCSKQERWIL